MPAPGAGVLRAPFGTRAQTETPMSPNIGEHLLIDNDYICDTDSKFKCVGPSSRLCLYFCLNPMTMHCKMCVYIIFFSLFLSH